VVNDLNLPWTRTLVEDIAPLGINAIAQFSTAMASDGITVSLMMMQK
jgi:hypothetical protein